MSEAIRLGHINVFRYGAILECIIDIHVRKSPTTGESNAQDKLDGLRLDNRAECVGIINVELLMKPLATERAL